MIKVDRTKKSTVTGLRVFYIIYFAVLLLYSGWYLISIDFITGRNAEFFYPALLTPLCVVLAIQWLNYTYRPTSLNGLSHVFFVPIVFVLLQWAWRGISFQDQMMELVTLQLFGSIPTFFVWYILVNFFAKNIQKSKMQKYWNRVIQSLIFIPSSIIGYIYLQYVFAVHFSTFESGTMTRMMAIAIFLLLFSIAAVDIFWANTKQLLSQYEWRKE